MANKAIVSKIQEEKYISGTGKKPVYPVTLDKAVKVKKEDGKTYTTLVNALNSKFGDAIVLGFWQDLSAEEKVQEYYMFTFRYGKGMEGNPQENYLNYKGELIYALTCSNEDFIDLCLMHDDEDGADINESLKPQTVASLKDRVKNSRYLNTLYLRMIHLNGEDIPTIYLKDENGNVYKSGDTINFTSYPAKLWLCAENMNSRYVDFVEKVYLDNSQGIVHNLKIYSDEVDSTDEDTTVVEMHFNDHATNTSEIPYENPLFTPRYYEDTISIIQASNEFTNIILNEGFLFYVMPSDYPYNGTVEEVTAYCTQVKQGIFRINDIFKDRESQEESINPIGFPSSYFNIIFTLKQEDEPILPFALDQLHQKTVLIKKNNAWTGTLEVKGENAVSNMAISMYIPSGDNDIRFAFKRESSLLTEYTETLDLTPEEVNTGIRISVRPVGWQDNEMYVPFGKDTPTQIDRTILMQYEETTYSNKLSCIITKEDIPIVDSPIVEEYVEDSFSTYDYYCLLRVPDEWEGAKISAIDAQQVRPATFSIYYLLPQESLYTEMPGGITISNILYNIENRFEEPIRTKLGDLIDTTVCKYICIKANVFSGDVNNPLPDVGGSITIANADNIYEVIILKYGTAANQNQPVDGYPQSSFEYNTHVFTIPTGDRMNAGNITGRMTDYSTVKNVLTNVELEEVKQLPSGIFSGLEDLEDASFVQHMDILQELPKYAFYNCPNLDTVILPPNITTIDDYAFAGCTSLESLVIPDSVTHIGRGICEGCTALTEVVFGAGLTDVTSIYGFTDSPLTDIWVRSEILPFIEPPYGLGIETPTFSSDITGENSDGVTLHFLAEIKIPIQDEELHVTGYDTVTLTDGQTVENSPIANTPWGLFPNATIRLIEVE